MELTRVRKASVYSKRFSDLFGNLTNRQVLMLELIALEDGLLAMSDIAERTGMPKSIAGRNLNGFVDEGYISFVYTGTDARAKRAKLTPKCLDLLEQVFA